MASVTAAMVKDLREKTGAGMMDCKNALNETGGEIEAAIDWLRKKGLSKAAKKSGRVAAEGLVAVAVRGFDGVVVEVNSETDFVARNEDFQALARNIAQVAATSGVTDVEALKAAQLSGRRYGQRGHRQRHRDDWRKHDLAARGRRACPAKGLSANTSIMPSPRDSARSASSSPWSRPATRRLWRRSARLIALHVAAASPLALDSSGLDPATIEREKSVLADKNAGKPSHVLEKIVESGLKTYYKEVCLLDQPSIHAEHGE